MATPHNYYPQTFYRYAEGSGHNVPFLAVYHGQLIPHVRNTIMGIREGGYWLINLAIEPGYQEFVIAAVKRNLHTAMLEARAPELVTHLHHKENPFLAEQTLTDAQHAKDIAFAILHDEADAAVDRFAAKVRAATEGEYRGVQYVYADGMWADLFPYDLLSEDPTARLRGLAVAPSKGARVGYWVRNNDGEWQADSVRIPNGHQRMNLTAPRGFTVSGGKFAMLNMGGGELTLNEDGETSRTVGTLIDTLEPGEVYIFEESRSNRVNFIWLTWRPFSRVGTLRNFRASVNGSFQAIIPEFSADVFNYAITVPADAIVTVSGGATDSRATLRVRQENDIHTISVQPEDPDADPVEYHLTVQREAADDSGSGNG